MSRPVILDPKTVPVTGVDTHLPAIAPAALTPAALRARFAAAPIWQPEIPGDGSLFATRPPAAASVLIALVMRESGVHLLLTRRTDHLRDHAGQISFPGGRVEPEDGSAVETALRETEEEIGLDRSYIEIIGQLPIYTTVTAFQVTPVVALVKPGFDLTLDAVEVAEAFEVPLQFLMTPAHHQRHSVEFEGGQRQFLSMPWMPADAVDASGTPRDYFIWGATAAMLRNFYRFLSA